MFGYIRPQKPELLVKEFEQYRGVYCALCRRLGKSYGVISRLTLSYDATFFALVLLGLGGGCPGFERRRCVVNPLKKCNYCTHGEKELTLAATFSVVLSYHKVRDDIEDGGFGEKLRSYLLLPFAAHARKRAKRDFPELDRFAEECMEQQRRAEHSENPGLDLCAEPTAKLLGQAFPFAVSQLGMDASEDSPLGRLTHRFGYFLGRWVYLIDAADDMEKDARADSFNPFNIKYQLSKASTQQDFTKAKAAANETLNLTLSQAAPALELMEFPQFGPIIRNVVLLGLPGVQKEVLFAKEKKNVRSL